MKVFSMLVLVIAMGASTWAHVTEGQRTEPPTTLVCTLKVAGMTCAGCEVAVRIAARSVEGVTDVKVSHAKGDAVVTYDAAKTTPSAIAKVITDKSGFKAEFVNAGAKN